MTVGFRIPSQSFAAEALAKVFDDSDDATALKLANPAIWTPRQDLTRFLTRHELFKLQLETHGSIVECGVGHGAGVLAWLQFSSIYEPINHNRRVIGFDTFEGFPDLAEEDALSTSDVAHAGGLAVDSAQQIMECAHFHNANRSLGQVTKVELVKGDATESIPSYIDSNPYLVVSLLYLDFDLYEPTLIALDYFLPRMPKGAVLAFDQLNIQDWPGETLAALQQIDFRGLELRRFPWGPTTCYAIL